VAERNRAEAAFLSSIKQFTFAGRRSGEGYFSRDGKKMVFQSERHEGNPFYQIYVANLITGDVQRVSPGQGKTTCAWIHPDGNRVMFASTHDDSKSLDHQKQEYKLRASSTKRRYSWDYDEHFELYEKTVGGKTRRLTHALGYDAEGSYSPDGKQIAFASNRHAYVTPPTGKALEAFKLNKSIEMDLYIMNADGSNVRRLTTSAGYDGGPFFSADGKRICWRRFGIHGHTAEIFTMKTDGTDEKQLTRLGHMSWAPTYHPSGDYLIFSTNKHGFGNFELFLVDAAGQHDPVRVTHRDGFDGLPDFSPDGKKLTWTTKRGGKGSQIFIAEWDHYKAMDALDLKNDLITIGIAEKKPSTSNLKKDVAYLASEELGGRLTGTKGEQLATAYFADRLKQLGLEPAGEDNGFYQKFSFTSGIELTDDNQLVAIGGKAIQPKTDWVPVSFSKNIPLKSAIVVFAGYGIEAPKTESFKGYDSYVHLDVKDKWVMVVRASPTKAPKATQQALRRFGPLVQKAMIARDKGAAGIIFVSGHNPQFAKRELVPLQMVGSLGRTSLGALSITNSVAAAWLAQHTKHTLKGLFEKLDKGDQVMGFELKGLKLDGNINLKTKRSRGRNTLGILRVADKPTKEIIVIGAHIDHLGRNRAGSRARKENVGKIHYGADDNASGIAVLMEVAATLTAAKKAGTLPKRRDVLIAAWSGEELGLIGSTRFATDAIGGSDRGKPKIVAYLNMDMVGRFNGKVAIQGVGSSAAWRGLIERANMPLDLNARPSDDTYLPTDTTPFYTRGVPILAAFTGVHDQYHTPRDTPDLLDYNSMLKISRFMSRMTVSLMERTEPLKYLKRKRPTVARGALKVFLGTVPDYSGSDVPGMKLSGVVKGGPADIAGLKSGDIIISLGSQKVENIYDYMRAIGKLKATVPAPVLILRGGQKVKLTIKPGARP
jgi:Tol biopolymer transport system component